MVLGRTVEVTEGISDMRTMFLVGLGPADRCSGTISEEGVQGFQVGTIKGIRVRGPSCFFIIINVGEEARESFAN